MPKILLNRRLIFIFFIIKCSIIAIAIENYSVLIPAGVFHPFFKAGLVKKDSEEVKIKSFFIDAYPVTNADFLIFVTHHAEWQRSKVKRIFAEKEYLKHWRSDTNVGDSNILQSPITNVSWFAAKAYCSSKGKTLPTTEQWEYVAADKNNKLMDATKEQVLNWYSVPSANKLPNINNTQKNGYGVFGILGVTWEWTLNFSNLFTEADQRNMSENNALFCGAGAINAVNAADYITFMRYSFRNSLKANYTSTNLGFRCAMEKK